MDHNAIETKGTEVTAKEEKKMNGKKIVKGLAIGGGIAAGCVLVVKVLKTIFGSNSNETECGYVEYDPEIDNVESDVSTEE